MSLTAQAIELPGLTPRDLAHIPGENGLPVIGHTLRVLGDYTGEHQRMLRRYGPVYRNFTFGLRFINLIGPEANELVMFDRNRLFSSAEGWRPYAERLFPNGLVMFDFEAHRVQRRALSVAFKAEAMKAYLAGLNAGIAEAVAGLAARGGEIRFYPWIKALTLNLAATCFFGRDLGADLEICKRAFIEMAEAIVAVIRAPLPGTQMARGVAGRKTLAALLKREIPARREGRGEDLFAELCRATQDDGAPLSDQQVVDHMIFMMFAAHDTLTSALTSFVQFLCLYPKWQARLREEARALGLAAGAPLPFERLDELALTEMAFKETLRLLPPVTGVNRRLLRDAEFAGHRLPEGAWIATNSVVTHRLPEVWPEPETFDPLRFTEENTRARHKFAYTPFGGGAHMCIGANFAQMQAKAFAYNLLTRAQLSLPDGYAPRWRMLPIPRPRDGLRLSVAPLA